MIVNTANCGTLYWDCFYDYSTGNHTVASCSFWVLHSSVGTSTIVAALSVGTECTLSTRHALRTLVHICVCVCVCVCVGGGPHD